MREATSPSGGRSAVTSGARPSSLMCAAIARAISASARPVVASASTPTTETKNRPFQKTTEVSVRSDSAPIPALSPSRMSW